MKNYLFNTLKGVAMGAANVIPGVSGGTIALITGVFERLIHAIKSFNFKALKLLFSGKFKEFASYTDFGFVATILIGIIFAIVSLARIFDYLFINYPVFIWAYFFGLVLSSVFFVGQRIDKWNISVFITLIIGAAAAIFISILNPATENDSFTYLILCGMVAICSMILPGLSGSFILILMGNYQLIAIDAINDLRWDILLPVLIGAGVGLVLFSHLLSWIFKKYRNQTIALLTGFIFGSVFILWPWQKATYYLDEFGNKILKDGEPVIFKYEKFFPETLSLEVILAILIILTGIASIWLLEITAKKNKEEN